MAQQVQEGREMRLGFHYHIPAQRRDGAIWMPGYQARFLDSLANQCEEVVCFLHEPRDAEKILMDTPLTSTNIRLVACGSHDKAPLRLLRGGRYVRPLVGEFGDLDCLLLRGPSPLLPAFARAAGTKPVALLLVGSYVEGIESLRGPAWRRMLVGALARWNQRQQDRIARNTLVLVNSRQLLRAYEGRTAGLDEVRTTTLSEEDFFQRDDTCLGRPVRMLYCGRFDQAKGLADMVEAMALLVREGRDVVLDMVGWEDGNTGAWKEAEEAAEGLGVPDRLFNHGRKAVGPELFAHYRSSDIFLIASRSHFEGFPRVLWEAMANSMPVVATAVGSIPDFLEDGNEALLVAPRDPSALAGAVRRILDDGDLRRRLIIRGREVACGVTLDRGAAKLMGAIRGYLAEKHDERVDAG